MENPNNKKLLASALFIVVSLALLVGLTFAWFTDSATSKGNKIQSGTLNIDLLRLGTDGEYASVGEAPVFNYDKWEPGYTDCAVLQIKNNGNLALKYQLQLVVSGEVGKLGDVIDVYVKKSATPITSEPLSFSSVEEDSAYEKAGTLASLLSKEGSAMSGVLLPKGSEAGSDPDTGVESVYLGIVLHMRENAGNEYQNLSAFEKLDVNLIAAQYTYEKDGFESDQYDAGAAYPVMDSTSLGQVTSKKVVDLESDIFVTAGEEIDTDPERIIIKNNKVTLNLNGNSIHFDSGKGENNFALFFLQSAKAGMIVNGEGTIDATATTGAYCFHLMGGQLSQPTLTINGGTYIGNPTVVNVEYGTATINGGFFSCKPAENADAGSSPYLLNCIDANYKKKRANIIVTGGTFVNFNPADNQAEGEHTNFVADGYKVTSEKHGEDIWYTVVPE